MNSVPTSQKSHYVYYIETIGVYCGNRMKRKDTVKMQGFLIVQQVVSLAATGS
jgi:hypothetical protein